MLKQETLDYIIEKMRGDSLTPLGTGFSDRDTITPFLTSLHDAIVSSGVLYNNDLYKLNGVDVSTFISKEFRKGSPFLKGEWKIDKFGVNYFIAPIPEREGFCFRLFCVEAVSDKKPYVSCNITIATKAGSRESRYFRLFYYQSLVSKITEEYEENKKLMYWLLLNSTGLKGK